MSMPSIKSETNMRLQTIRLIICLLTGLASITSPLSAQEDATKEVEKTDSEKTDSPFDPVRVMSFNVRYGKANDGDNRWENRKELVAETIKEFKPDLLGLQELMKFQSDYIEEQVEGYTVFGRTREKTGPDGEYCSIFYRTERFAKVGGGHLWLSETPEVPGSKSWDSSLPRMVSWLCLSERNAPEKKICIFNTHFDHRGQEARHESGKLIAARARAIAKSFGNARIIVTGDFNTAEDSDPYKAFFEDETTKFVDTFRAKRPERSDNEGTFNGFEGRSTGARIDWVLVDSRWEIKSSEIVRKNDDGRYPSDHYPVTAVLR